MGNAIIGDQERDIHKEIFSFFYFFYFYLFLYFYLFFFFFSISIFFFSFSLFLSFFLFSFLLFVLFCSLSGNLSKAGRTRDYVILYLYLLQSEQFVFSASPRTDILQFKCCQGTPCRYGCMPGTPQLPLHSLLPGIAQPRLVALWQCSVVQAKAWSLGRKMLRQRKKVQRITENFSRRRKIFNIYLSISIKSRPSFEICSRTRSIATRIPLRLLSDIKDSWTSNSSSKTHGLVIVVQRLMDQSQQLMNCSVQSGRFQKAVSVPFHISLCSRAGVIHRHLSVENTLKIQN